MKLMSKEALIVAVFLLFINFLSAQSNLPYTSFINKDTSIPWAAEYRSIVNLTPPDKGTDLKKWYLSKIKSRGARAYSFNKDKTVKSTRLFLNPSLGDVSWLKGYESRPSDLARQWWFRKVNDAGEYYALAADQYSKDSCCGCDESDAFNVQQVLYYSKGKLNIHNVYASPLCARKADDSHFQWYPLANVAYNGSTSSRPKDAVYLTRSSVSYEIGVRNRPEEISVLTTGDAELINYLVNDIQAGKVKAYDSQTNEAIPGDKFLQWRMPVDTAMVQNPNGGSAEIKTIQASINLQDLTRIRVQEDWYFDAKNERLYSEIKTVTLMRRVNTTAGAAVATTAYAILSFK